MYHIGVSRSETDYIQKLIAHLDAQSPGPSAERRTHPRIDFNHPLWLNLPADPGKPWVHVFARNLSTGGLAFLTRKLFYAGQYLVISHTLNESCPQLVLASVCFSRSVEMAILEIGLAFQTSLPDPENLRNIPPDWTAKVLRKDWLARTRFPQATLPKL